MAISEKMSAVFLSVVMTILDMDSHLGRYVVYSVRKILLVILKYIKQYFIFRMTNFMFKL